MKQKITIKTFLLLICLLLSIGVQAKREVGTVTKDQTLVYTLYDDQTAIVSECMRYTSGSIYVPCLIVYDDKKYTVEGIGDKAFYFCERLTEIFLTSCIKYIGNEAFRGCDDLTSFTIPDGVKSIGNSAFASCHRITTIDIPNSVTSIGSSAFNNCMRLKSITIPSSVTYIGAKAFWGTPWYNDYADDYGAIYLSTVLYAYQGELINNLHIKVKEGTTSISNEIFKDKTKLASIDIPESVKIIGENAFSGCTNLANIKLPGSITYIGSKAFEETAWFNSQPDGAVYINSILYRYKETVPAAATVRIKDGVNMISDNAFSNCAGVVSVTIPSSVTKIGYGSFGNCLGLKEVIFEDGTEKVEVRGSYSFIDIPIEKLYLGRNLSGNGAFTNKSTLTTVHLGNYVTDLEYLTFQGSRLDSVFVSLSVPFNLSSSTGLIKRNIYVPSGSELSYRKTVNWKDNNIIGINEEELSIEVKEPGTMATEIIRKGSQPTYVGKLKLSGTLNETDWEIIKTNMSYLHQLDLSELNNEEIPEAQFKDRTYLHSVKLPKNIKRISNSLFSGCKYLRNDFVFSSTLTDIGPYAFYKSAVSSVEFTGETAKIDSFAFNQSGLQTLIISNGRFVVDKGAFSACNKLKTIRIGDGKLDIKESAFNDCASLLSIKMGTGEYNIGKKAFQNCKSLVSVETGNGNYSIGSQAFRSCISLYSLTFGEGNYILSESVFQQCTSLSSVAFPKGKHIIGNYAFQNCTSLSSAGFNGEKLTVGNYAFQNCSSLSSVVFNPDEYSVGKYAFQNCTSLASAIFSGSKYSIGDNAFQDCGLLSSVVFAEGLKFIGESAFKNAGIVTLTLPKGLKSIEKSAFAGCSKLTGKVIIPETITKINNMAFSGSSLENIEIPYGLKEIGESAFSNCSGLKSLDLPITINLINNSAFSGCSGLMEVTVHTKQPLSINESVFGRTGGVDYVKCKLVVPSNSVANYLTSPGWKNFLNLNEGSFSAEFTMGVICNEYGKVKVQDKEISADTLSLRIFEDECYEFDFTPDENYKLSSFRINGDEFVSEVKDGKYNTAAVKGNVNIITTFTKKKYVVKAPVNDISYGSVYINDNLFDRPVEVEHGSEVHFKIKPADAYKINNVILNREDITDRLVDGDYTVTAIADTLTLFTTFEKKFYKVDVNNADDKGMLLINGQLTSDVLLEHGTSVVLEFIPVEGYRLSDAKINGKSVLSDIKGGKYTIESVSENLLVEMSYIIKTFRIDVYKTGVGTVTVNGEGAWNGTFTANYGDEIIVKIVPVDTYKLVKAEINSLDITNLLVNNIYKIDSIKENLYINVDLKIIPEYNVSVQYKKEAGKVLINNRNMAFGKFKEGEYIFFEFMPNEGYLLEQVTLNGEDVTESVQYNIYMADSITKDIAMKVLFVRQCHVSAVYDHGQGKVLLNNQELSSGMKINEGEEITLSIVPEENFKIKRVLFNGNDITDRFVDESSYTVVVEENILLRVDFEVLSPILNTTGEKLKIYSLFNNVIIENIPDGETVSVCDVTGKLIYLGTSDNIYLNSGLYIVKVGNVISKIIIK